jgi:hypothetical protein
MANEALLNLGTELILESSGTSGAVADGAAPTECDSATRASTDNTGYPLGIFEFSTDGTDPWNGAPTAGAAIHLYERKVNSDLNEGPVVDANYKHDYLYTFNVDPADAVQHFTSPPLPINRGGGRYYIEWIDGGTGVVQLQAGWELRLTPVTYGTA